MNKYEYKQLKKQKRLERKKLRKETRTRNKFERLSKTEYKLWHRIIIKTLRIGGPVAALLYVLYRIYDVFWIKVYNEQVLVPDSSLKYMLLTGFFVLFLFMWFYPSLIGWVKKARQANANARNTGNVSYEYSTFMIDFVKVNLLAVPLGFLALFDYISTRIGPEFTYMFEDISKAYGIGAMILLLGSMLQDRILKRIKHRQKKAEHITQMNIYDLNKENDNS
jgi:hypothetical protein